MSDTLRIDADARPGRLRLVVIEDGISVTHALPEHGSVVIGRSKESDVRLEDASVSRRHAVLHVDSRLRIEDLGSANGTRVRDRRLTPNETVDLQPGDAVEIGRALLIVQRELQPVRASRLLTHDYFEARVEDECARGERGAISFAVARLHAPALPQQVVVERAGLALRPGDVTATYGPADLEVLLVDTRPDDAEACAQRLRAAIGRGCAVGLSCFPRDGRSAPALLQHANGAVRGASSETTPLPSRSEAMERLRQLVGRVAASDISVLILGETGVGKGVLAEEIHRRSRRAQGPFVVINCAAVAEALLESELFGHERGAFTGAHQAKPGLIETAESGTLLLDEIGEMPLSMQAKLLRVLEDREVRRVGAVRPRKVDVRILAATNRDLAAEVRRGTFRQDLYFRLDRLSLVVPPLRERTDEIEGLARGFLEQIGGNLTLSSEAIEVMRRYPWPGNVRELRNAIERATVLCSGGSISPEHLPRGTVRTTVFSPAGDAVVDDDVEKHRIEQALLECGGNQSRAAELLGISRRTVVSRIAKYGLRRPRRN